MRGLALPASLAAITRCAGDSSRYSMSCVEVADPGGGQYKATVTDGRRLLHVQGHCPVDRGKITDRGELGTPPDVPVYCPRDSWDLMFRISPKLTGHARYAYASDKNMPVRILRQSDGRLLLSSAERTVTTDQVDGKFPNWRDVMPKDKPAAVVHVQPKLLAELLTSIASMLPDDNQRVAICLWHPTETKQGLDARVMAVVAKNNTNNTCIDGLLMPLEPPPPEEKKREPQTSIDETVEEFFTECFDLAAEHVPEEEEEFAKDVEYYTDEIEDTYDLPWSRDVVQKAVEAALKKELEKRRADGTIDTQDAQSATPSEE